MMHIQSADQSSRGRTSDERHISLHDEYASSCGVPDP